MIRYALVCAEDHEFEAWFASSDAYDEQAAAGLVECPVCGTTEVTKQVMAPAVSSKTKAKGARTHSNQPDVVPDSASASASHGDRPSVPGDAKEFEAFAAKVRAHIRSTHTYVGESFAQEARAMHEGEKDQSAIYGEATPEEAKALREDGVPAAPLPPPFAPIPPKKAN